MPSVVEEKIIEIDLESEQKKAYPDTFEVGGVFDYKEEYPDEYYEEYILNFASNTKKRYFYR